MKIIDKQLITPNTPTCHAATIEIFQDRTFISWFGGTREGALDSAIYMMEVKNDDINKNEKKCIVGHGDLMPRWNPILFAYKDELYCFIKMGVFCDRWQSLFYKVKLSKNGFELDEKSVQYLPAGFNGPVKLKPIVEHGMIYCGSSVETLWDWTAFCEILEINDGKLCYFDRSRPLTVPKVKYFDNIFCREMLSKGIIQPSIWIHDNIKQAFFRSSHGLNKIYYSKNYKLSGWSDPVPTSFDNPNSGIDTICCNGRLFLAHNPSKEERFPLVLSELDPLDKDFKEKGRIIIEEKVDGKTYSEELSYPYMICRDNIIHLVFTYGRTKICYVKVEME